MQKFVFWKINYNPQTTQLSNSSSNILPEIGHLCELFSLAFLEVKEQYHWICIPKLMLKHLEPCFRGNAILLQSACYSFKITQNHLQHVSKEIK